MGFLTAAIESVRADLRAHPLTPSPPDPGRAPRDLERALSGSDVAVIAELKRASPSAGAIAEADAARLAAQYQAGGAAALSVLTERAHFGGSLDDLVAARAATELPILRKDFIIDASQIAEARAAGADAVLLIAAALDRRELTDLVSAAGELGLGSLVETHSAAEIDLALEVGARIVGVNARDLETLEVNLGRAVRLLGTVPPGVVRVLESGVSTRDDVLRAAAGGADAVLVGEALMRAADPAAKLRELLGGHGRRDPHEGGS
jgi:indole-3-glycerol phosphate synthase